MKVILLTDIPKVGNRYDVKDFAQGYAQNVLLSKGLAELATPQALAKLEAHKKAAQHKKTEELKAFEELIKTVGNTIVTVPVKANDKGHLFKAVSAKDVVKAIKDASGVEIEESNLHMDHIKELGEHSVIIKKGDKEGKCTVVVTIQK